MKNERIFIIGCGGMLGSYVYEEFKKDNELLCYDIDDNEEWIEYGDINDLSFLYKTINTFNPTIVINLAALTDLEYCENHIKEAYSTNTNSAEYLGDICNELGCIYVFISTAGIFDGKREVFTEYEQAFPLSVYGNSKQHSENTIVNRVTRCYVIRAGWMFGGGKKDKKFISKITKQINSGKKEIFVVVDKLGTPTYTKDFARSIYNIIENKLPYGVYNSVNKGKASRYETAKKLIELLGLDIKLTKVDSDYFIKEYFSPRPKSEQLINLKLDMLGQNIMRHWEDALEDYVNNGKYNEI